MQISPQSPKVLRQEDSCVFHVFAPGSPPRFDQQALVRRRVQRHPMWTIHTVAAAHPSPDPGQLLPAATAIRARRPVGITTHLKLRIKTRLDQLSGRVRQEVILRSGDEPRDERRTGLVRHPAGGAELPFRECPRQSALHDQRREAPGQRLALDGRKVAPVLGEKTGNERRHQTHKFLLSRHRKTPGHSPPRVNRPTRPPRTAPP